MRIIRLFLVTLLFTSISSIAQEREFDGTIMVLGTSHGQGYENLAAGCAWAEPYVPSGIELGMTFDLEPAMLDEQSGSMAIIDGAGEAFTIPGGATPEKFGELWVCAGPMEFLEDPVTGGSTPERIVAYVIIIGDTAYGALGEIRPQTYLGFPQEGMAVWTGGAEVVALVDDQPTDLIGAMSVNVLENRLGIEGYHNGLVLTLRLHEARDRALEAATEAFESSL